MIVFFAFIIVMFLLWQAREFLFEYVGGNVEVKVGMADLNQHSIRKIGIPAYLGPINF